MALTIAEPAGFVIRLDNGSRAKFSHGYGFAILPVGSMDEGAGGPGRGLSQMLVRFQFRTED
jgi:hypothetical protein